MIAIAHEAGLHNVSQLRADDGLGKGFALYGIDLSAGATATAADGIHPPGQGTRHDKAQAAKAINDAATAGVPAAMFRLSNMLYAGDGVAKDEQAAHAWLERAAEGDHPEAMQQLAMALRDGSMGFERDEQRAAVLMKEMAHAMKHRAPAP